MLKSILRRAMAAIAPEWERQTSESRWLRQDARELRPRLEQSTSIEERVEIACSALRLRSNQKRFEIQSLLREIERLQPTTMCEIGADRGGTLALFATVMAPHARILSIDLRYHVGARKIYPLLAGDQQTITCLEGDSHTPTTLAEAKRRLKGKPLDFLFIDGDHSYAGVKADYEMYGSLVRPGGVIAFHDIVPDCWTRFGKRTECDVGEVPRFWQEIRQSAVDSAEFIEDPNQDGYGIGLIRVSAK